MTPEEQKYFDDMFEMFGTQGWRNLVDEARKTIYQFQAEALEAPTFEQVCYLRGQAEQLARIINLADQMRLVRETQLAEDDEEVKLLGED